MGPGISSEASKLASSLAFVLIVAFVVEELVLGLALRLVFFWGELLGGEEVTEVVSGLFLLRIVGVLKTTSRTSNVFAVDSERRELLVLRFLLVLWDFRGLLEDAFDGWGLRDLLFAFRLLELRVLVCDHS